MGMDRVFYLQIVFPIISHVLAAGLIVGLRFTEAMDVSAVLQRNTQRHD